MAKRAVKTFLPGATLGILGGGQLGRMIALEAKRMGYRCGVLDPAEHGPCAQVADFHVRAQVGDAAAARELARRCDAVTLEWELIPLGVLEAVARAAPLFPGASVLENLQDRLAQRRFLEKNGFPQTRFWAVAGREDLSAAVRQAGLPCVVKRRRHGYDGKGQFWLRVPRDLDGAAEVLEDACVLEAAVPFAREVSAIVVRGQTGELRAYPVAENLHRNGILHATFAPARVPAGTARRAVALASGIAKALGHVGVLAVELFELPGGRLLVNEIAPRVHNSGHFTWGACKTSQFEQHARAVLGLPLGDPAPLSPALMVNLLGELWSKGEPRWARLLAQAGVSLHLYGKDRPAPGRKMGHLLALAPSAKDPFALADRLLALL